MHVFYLMGVAAENCHVKEVTVAAEPAWPHQQPCERGQCDCSAPSVFYILLP